MSLKDIEYFVSKQKKKVRDNVEIIEANKQYPYMLHGSINGNIKAFKPRLAERYAKGYEDRTVDRVHVSDHLMGCIEAMNELLMYLLYGAYYEGMSKKEERYMAETYKGGWYIYAIRYDYCLKPNEKLVFDQNITNEHWLVNYNSYTKKYIGEKIAKLILISYYVQNVGANSGNGQSIYILEITDKSLKLEKDGEYLLPGYYEIIYNNKLNKKNNSNEMVVVRELKSYRPISQTEYNNLKKKYRA